MPYLANLEAHSRKSLEYKREDAETIGLYFAPRHGRWGFVGIDDGRLVEGQDQGTAPLGITPAGIFMGLYIDAQGGHHWLHSQSVDGMRGEVLLLGLARRTAESPAVGRIDSGLIRSRRLGRR
jgi:hypothetical protein